MNAAPAPRSRRSEIVLLLALLVGVVCGAVMTLLMVRSSTAPGTSAVVPPPQRGQSETCAAREAMLERRYLDTARDSLLGLTHRTTERSVVPNHAGTSGTTRPLQLSDRMEGKDWPVFGLTMVGGRRMENIEWALRKVVGEGVPGDFMECGVWRGGASIFARAVLDTLGEDGRKVILADSFEGLPAPRTGNDKLYWSQMEYLRVSLETVKQNVASYGMNPEASNMQFCKGYFVDSLPVCQVNQLAVLRMDGDMYESTMDQLFNLYQKVSVGGVVIVDDYGLPECKRAINEFKTWHNMDEPLVAVDSWSGRYWIKQKKLDSLHTEKYDALVPKKSAK
eukprot:TRINITY_DN1278_c0_g1_i4.p2 TRINITY_DN1278_c0_g1~~TRINITY_DN1278_c0_g1_i4.p2  ORF type:complete len:336 (-),score=77.90 TRINITY_DN1278_c0_g1_i4:49-1056(-)